MTAPSYDGDDVERIAADYVAYERDRQRIKDDARYFTTEIRRDFTATEIARLIRQPTLPDMEPPDERGVRRLEELAMADPAVLVQIAIEALWYGGPSVTALAEHELRELNNVGALIETPGYVGRRRHPEDGGEVR